MAPKTAKKSARKPSRAGAAKARRAPVDLREELLLATLPHVAQEGWSDLAILKGADDVGITEDNAFTLFEGGADEMLFYFINWADMKMLKILPEAEMKKLRVRDRVALGVRARLEVVAPFKAAVAKALQVLAKPWHALEAARAVYTTCDLIWIAAGDTSTDYNFYTKRGLLAGVYTSTLLRFLADNSKDNEETWAFLDQRIENVMQIEKMKAAVKARFAA